MSKSPRTPDCKYLGAGWKAIRGLGRREFTNANVVNGTPHPSSFGHMVITLARIQGEVLLSLQTDQGHLPMSLPPVVARAVGQAMAELAKAPEPCPWPVGTRLRARRSAQWKHLDDDYVRVGDLYRVVEDHHVLSCNPDDVVRAPVRPTDLVYTTTDDGVAFHRDADWRSLFEQVKAVPTKAGYYRTAKGKLLMVRVGTYSLMAYRAYDGAAGTPVHLIEWAVGDDGEVVEVR